MKNLSSTDFQILLTRLGACQEAVAWANNKSLAEVWATCHRGDWMLWLLARHGDVPHKAIVAIACYCS